MCYFEKKMLKNTELHKRNIYKFTYRVALLQSWYKIASGRMVVSSSKNLGRNSEAIKTAETRRSQTRTCESNETKAAGTCEGFGEKFATK